LVEISHLNLLSNEESACNSLADLNLIVNLLTTHIARILFAFPFLAFGILHLFRAADMSAMVEGKMPGDGKIWIYLTGIVMVISALTIITKKFDYWGSLALAFVLLLYVAVLHAPEAAGDSAMSAISMSNALKDLGLAGGALIYAGTARPGLTK